MTKQFSSEPRWNMEKYFVLWRNLSKQLRAAFDIHLRHIIFITNWIQSAWLKVSFSNLSFSILCCKQLLKRAKRSEDAGKIEMILHFSTWYNIFSYSRFLSSPKTFGGDPCPGIRKFIEVAYKCRPSKLHFQENFREKYDTVYYFEHSCFNQLYMLITCSD